MFDFSKLRERITNRHPMVDVACFLLFCVVPSYFLFGVHDFVKSLIFPNIYTTTSTVTDTFFLSGACREKYSTIGMKVRGEIQVVAWTHRLNGKIVGEPSPHFTVNQRIIQEPDRFLMFDASGKLLQDVPADTIDDYDAPERISINVRAHNGIKPNLSPGKMTIEAEGEFDDTHSIRMVCDLEIMRPPLP